MSNATTRVTIDVSYPEAQLDEQERHRLAMELRFHRDMILADVFRAIGQVRRTNTDETFLIPSHSQVNFKVHEDQQTQTDPYGEAGVDDGGPYNGLKQASAAAKLYVIYTQVYNTAENKWNSIHVTTRKGRQGAKDYIDQDREVDTTCGGLLPRTKPGTVRYEVRECEVLGSVFIDKTTGVPS